VLLLSMGETRAPPRFCCWFKPFSINKLEIGKCEPERMLGLLGKSVPVHLPYNLSSLLEPWIDYLSAVSKSLVFLLALFHGLSLSFHSFVSFIFQGFHVFHCLRLFGLM